MFKYYNIIGDEMEIKNIKKLKSGKYKLELNNDKKIVTYDEVILNRNLLFNKNIDEDLLNKIEIDTNYYDVYTKVLKYISIRMRSKKEILLYLEKKGIDEVDSKKIIDDLSKLNLINDEFFARAFSADKIYLNRYGRKKIKKELLEHDIDEVIIDSILNSYYDNIFKDNLKTLMEKKVKNSKYSGYILKQKLFYEFGNLGYENNIIEEVFSQIQIVSNIDHDFNKIYQQLSKKYEGNMLFSKIKNKLYSKGYSIDEINEIINNIL